MKNNVYYSILIILILTGATLRILAADYNNIWNDEWLTLRFSTQGNIKVFFVDNWSNNNSNFIYPILNYFYFKIIPPTSKLIIRFPALFFGILSIPLLFFVVRKFFGNETALTATVLLTFNFFHILYSKEARPYSLYILLTIISLYYFIKNLRSQYCVSNRAKLFFINALMYWTHPLSIFLIVTEYLFLYLNLVFKEKKITINSLLKIFYKNLLIEGIVFFAFTILRIHILTNQVGLSWIWKPGIYNLIGIYSAMLQYSYIVTSGCLDCNLTIIHQKLFYYVIFIVLFLVALIVFSSKTKSKEFIRFIKKNKIFLYFLFVVIFVLPVIIFLISQFKPFLTHKYLSFMFIPLILMISFIFTLLNKQIRYGLIVLISVIALYSLFQSLQFNAYNPSYDQLFELLKERDEKAILIIGDYFSFSDFMLKYYRENKNFDYNNVISFDDINTNEVYDGYLFIKSWVLVYGPWLPLNEPLKAFEERVIKQNCVFKNYEINNTERLFVSRITCEK